MLACHFLAVDNGFFEGHGLVVTAEYHFTFYVFVGEESAFVQQHQCLVIFERNIAFQLPLEHGRKQFVFAIDGIAFQTGHIGQGCHRRKILKGVVHPILFSGSFTQFNGFGIETLLNTLNRGIIPVFLGKFQKGFLILIDFIQEFLTGFGQSFTFEKFFIQFIPFIQTFIIRFGRVLLIHFENIFFKFIQIGLELIGQIIQALRILEFGGVFFGLFLCLGRQFAEQLRIFLFGQLDACFQIFIYTSERRQHLFGHGQGQHGDEDQVHQVDHLLTWGEFSACHNNEFLKD